MSVEIIDSHIHYWEASRPARPWDPAGVDMGRPFSVDELIAEATAAGVTQVVQVTPSCMGYDNRYAFEGAGSHPDRVFGVFIRFDPAGSDMPERLAKERSRAKFLGVRQTLMGNRAGWLADGTLDAFLAEAGKQRVPVAIATTRAKELKTAAQRHPQTRILVDHMGLRAEGENPFEYWPDVLALSEAPNVYVKVSKFPEVSHEPFPFKNAQGRFKELFDRFGPDRLIWGSNFPPSKHACTYKQSVEFTLEACDFLSGADKQKILAGTLKSVVRV